MQVRLTPELQELLTLGVTLDDVVGIISSNLVYMLALEYGHSQGQAPTGMVRAFARQYNEMLLAELTHALQVYGPDVRQAVRAGVSLATLEILRAIAERTPVDTGRAKGDWVATLPGGRRLNPEGTRQISEAQQRAIIRRRRRRRRT